MTTNSSPEEYLNQKIRPIVEALAEAVVIEDPEDPVSNEINNSQINLNIIVNYIL